MTMEIVPMTMAMMDMVMANLLEKEYVERTVGRPPAHQTSESTPPPGPPELRMRSM